MWITSYQSFNWVSPIDGQGLLSTTRFDRLAPFRNTPPCQAALPVSRFQARLVEVKASIGRAIFPHWTAKKRMQNREVMTNQVSCAPMPFLRGFWMKKSCLTISKLYQEEYALFLPTSAEHTTDRSHVSFYCVKSTERATPPGAFCNSHRYSVGRQGCGEEAKAVRREHWQDATTSQTRWG